MVKVRFLKIVFSVKNWNLGKKFNFYYWPQLLSTLKFSNTIFFSHNYYMNNLRHIFYFRLQFYVAPILFRPQFFWNTNFLNTLIFLKHQFFENPNFCETTNFLKPPIFWNLQIFWNPNFLKTLIFFKTSNF